MCVIKDFTLLLGGPRHWNKMKHKERKTLFTDHWNVCIENGKESK